MRLRAESHSPIYGIFKVTVGILCLLLIDTDANTQEQPIGSRAIRTGIEGFTIVERIDLKSGEKKSIRAPEKLAAVAVTRPEIVEGYRSGAQDVLLIANSPGLGKVLLQFDDGNAQVYSIRVFVADPEEFADSLKEKLKNIKNLNIELIRGKILVEGGILSQNDLNLIERVVADNPSVINLTFLNPRNPQTLAQEIEQGLKEGGIPGVKVEIGENKMTLVGTVASDALKKKAEQIAGACTPHFVSLLKLEAPIQQE